MVAPLLHFVQFIVLSVLCITTFAQNKYSVKLAIDTDCVCSDALVSELQGSFGLYTMIELPWSTGDHMHQLQMELDFVKEQTLFLEQGNYQLIYRDKDPNKDQHLYYFSVNPIFNEIHLNCFFFKLAYPSFLDRLMKKESLIFSSSYFGMTNDDTVIPTHTVIIERKRKEFYASYYYTEHRGPVIPVEPIWISEPESGERILLTDTQLDLIRNFENQLHELSTNNLNASAISRNYILIDGKKVQFDSQGYIAHVLWEKLTRK